MAHMKTTQLRNEDHLRDVKLRGEGHWQRWRPLYIWKIYRFVTEQRICGAVAKMIGQNIIYILNKASVDNNNEHS